MKLNLGRPCIYPGKDKRRGRVSGLLTPAGWKSFEAARQRAARLAGVKPAAVSDGETVDYLARCWQRSDLGDDLYR